MYVQCVMEQACNYFDDQTKPNTTQYLAVAPINKTDANTAIKGVSNPHINKNVH